MNNTSRIILLVEDNADDEELTIRALTRGNFENEIIVAHNGVEALEFLHGGEAKTPGPLPALVLLDLKLPKIDGLEVLRRLREHERTRLIPVVVLTSSSEERDILESYHLRANSYVRKPVDFVKFTEAVRQIGTYWLHINELPRGLYEGG